MKNMFIISLLIIAFIIIGCAGNCKTKNDLDENVLSLEADVLTGIINVRGNEPFTYLSIENEHGNIFEIDSPDSLQNILWKLQGHKVTLQIQETRKNLNRVVVVAKSYKLNPTEKQEMDK